MMTPAKKAKRQPARRHKDQTKPPYPQAKAKQSKANSLVSMNEEHKNHQNPE
jgi:hypothetical protein